MGFTLLLSKNKFSAYSKKKERCSFMDRVRKIINAEAAYKRGYFGENIGVAILDTGIFPHIDFGRRMVFFKDYVGSRRGIYDDNGHGTHIAGIIGGDGMASNGRYMGIAPRCHFIIIKILDRKGNGNTENVVQAIEWLGRRKEEYQIRIVNISIGMVLQAESRERIRLLKAVEYAWDHNLVVVAAIMVRGRAVLRFQESAAKSSQWDVLMIRRRELAGRC